MWSRKQQTAVWLSAAVLAGCSAGAAEMPAAQTASSSHELQADGMSSISRQPADRCSAFGDNFDALLACQRADGTLRAFLDQNIAWRVRYFVRYLAMPCGEYPTVQEGYAFHAVLDDLNRDRQLKGTERTAIRTAMFDGKVSCP